MLNKGVIDPKMKMVFEPSYVVADLGDCIKFLPTSKGHNAETIKEMLPKGAKKFKSRVMSISCAVENMSALFWSTPFETI
jgi:pseudoazurin